MIHVRYGVKPRPPRSRSTWSARRQRRLRPLSDAGARCGEHVIHYCATVLPFRAADDVSAWSQRTIFRSARGADRAGCSSWRGLVRGYLARNWRKWTGAEAQEIFTRVGLTGPHWHVRRRRALLTISTVALAWPRPKPFRPAAILRIVRCIRGLCVIAVTWYGGCDRYRHAGPGAAQERCQLVVTSRILQNRAMLSCSRSSVLCCAFAIVLARAPAWKPGPTPRLIPSRGRAAWWSCLPAAERHRVLEHPQEGAAVMSGQPQGLLGGRQGRATGRSRAPPTGPRPLAVWDPLTAAAAGVRVRPHLTTNSGPLFRPLADVEAEHLGVGRRLSKAERDSGSTSSIRFGSPQRSERRRPFPTGSRPHPPIAASQSDNTFNASRESTGGYYDQLTRWLPPSIPA